MSKFKFFSQKLCKFAHNLNKFVKNLKKFVQNLGKMIKILRLNLGKIKILHPQKHITYDYAAGN